MNKLRLILYRVAAIAPWLGCAVLMVALARQGIRSAPDFRNGDGAIFERPHEKASAEKNRADHPRLTEKELEKEWPEVKQFLSEHSRNRFAQIQKIPGGPKKGLQEFFVGRWRALTRLKTQSPELYDIKVREVELEDDIFGICRHLKRGAADKARLQSELKDKIASLFDLGLSERKVRIGLVESALAVQKETLKSDANHRNQLIEDRYRLVSTEGVEGAWFGAHSHASPGQAETLPVAPEAPASN